MTEENFRSAIAAEILAAAGARAELLGSVVTVARTMFLAAAASIALLDTDTDELVFEALSGEGEASLAGSRFPAGAGIAGAVLRSEEPLVLDDVARDPRFAASVAGSTGYVPRALMAAPLLRGERALGILTVLDRGATGRGSLQEVELLTAFANQAAIAVDLTASAIRARDLTHDDDELLIIARLAARLQRVGESRRAVGLRVLGDLAELLDG